MILTRTVPTVMGRRRSVASGGPPIPVKLLWRLTQGVNGALVTEANVNDGFLGGVGFTATRTPNHTEIEDLPEPVRLPSALLCDGVTVRQIEKLLKCNLTRAISVGASPLYEGFVASEAGNFSASLGEYVQFAIFRTNTIAGTNNVNFDMGNAEGGGFDFWQVQALANGIRSVSLHGSGGVNSVLGALLDGNTLYFASARKSNDAGSYYIEVFNLATGVSVGTIRKAATIGSVSLFRMWDYLLLDEPESGGGSLAYGLWGLIESTTKWPVRNNVVLAPPTEFVVAQSGIDKLTLEFKHLNTDAEIYRSDHDGETQGPMELLTTIASHQHTVATYIGGKITYHDETVEEGHTYAYEVKSKALNHVSAATAHAGVLVDNEPFAGVEPGDEPSLARDTDPDVIAESLGDNDPVSTAPDASGNGNDLTQTGSARPTLKLNVANGHAGLLFDRALGQHLIGTPIAGTERSWMVVIQPDLGDVSWEIMDTDGLDTYYRYVGDGNGYFGPFRTAPRLNGYPLAMPTSGVIVVAGRSTDDEYEIFVQGVSQGVEDGAFSPGTAFLLGGNAGMTRSFNGLLFRSVEWNADLGAAKLIEQSNSALGKYG